MVKLITHIDLDGVSCAILAKIVFKNNVDISFVKSPNLVNATLDSIENLTKFTTIFITDLSCDSKYVENISNLLLFDHHKTALYLNQFDNATVATELNGRTTCGTELFYQYLLKNYQIVPIPFFVELVRLYDTWEWSKFSSKLPYYLNNLLHIKGLNNFIDNYSYSLTFKDVNELNIFSQDERLLLNYYENSINKFIKDKAQYVHTKLVTINDKSFNVGICFTDRHQSMLGNTICVENNVDILIMLDLNKNTCALRAVNKSIDVSDIVKKITITSGGHQSAAGGILDFNFPELIYQTIFDSLSKSLNQQTENISGVEH